MQVSPTQAQEAAFHGPPLTIPVPAASPARPSPLRQIVSRYPLEVTAAVFILVAGLALRLLPCCGVPDRLTVDEHLYITNVLMLKAVGPYEYPALVKNYVDAQSRMDMVMLPPTRCVYILLGWAWDALFHSGPRMSLRYVAAMFSCFSFLLSGLFAFRLAGTRFALVVGALMAVAPLELVMAHRELVDGVFAFWALLSLWLLWENLQNPGRLGWLAAYSGSIAIMVLTKENAFFATAALCGIICTAMAFPGLNLGKVKGSTVAATIIGPLLGVIVLISIAGSPQTLLETYKLLVVKAEKMTFAYETGGGPWYRYIVDIMLVSPAVLLPAIGGIFALRRDSRQGIYLFLFIAFSCAIMVNVRNGMNLRYSTMWDMPLRFLAAGTLLRMATAVRRWPVAAGVILLTVVGGLELHSYCRIFVQYDTGDPVPQALMYSLEIMRAAP